MAEVTIMDLLLGWLATWRLTRLVTADSITEPWRDWIDGQTAVHTDGWVGRVVWFVADGGTCPWCLSVWVAFAVAAGWLVMPWSWWALGCAICGWSALTGIAETWVHREPHN